MSDRGDDELGQIGSIGIYQSPAKREWITFAPGNAAAIFSAAPQPVSISDFMSCHHILVPTTPLTPSVLPLK